MAFAKDVALVEKLRTWRRDASSLHQYDAAAFVGDKILSITSKHNFNFRGFEDELLIAKTTCVMRSGLHIFTFTASRTRGHTLSSPNLRT
jgi:hypothetical protein